MSIKEIIVVFVGGGFGSVCRYFMAILLPYKTFPYATLLVNIFGSFAIGMLLSFLFTTSQNSIYKLLLVTGFCGGFTTFSTFSFEFFQLIQQQKVYTAILYILASLTLSLAAVAVGYILVK